MCELLITIGYFVGLIVCSLIAMVIHAYDKVMYQKGKERIFFSFSFDEGPCICVAFLMCIAWPIVAPILLLFGIGSFIVKSIKKIIDEKMSSLLGVEE